MKLKEISVPRVDKVRVTDWGIRFFLAAVLMAAQAPVDYAPFALGFVSAAGCGTGGVAALLGVAAGAALFLPFSPALGHVAAAVLIVTFATAFRGTGVLQRSWVQPAAAGILFFVVKLAYLLQLHPVRGEPAGCLLASALTALAAWGFVPLLTRKPASWGWLFPAIALSGTVLDVTVGGVSAGRVLLGLVTLYAAQQRGRAEGAVTGLCGGLLADLALGDGGLLYGAVYGLCGVIAGNNGGHRRWQTAGLWIMGAVLVCLPLSGDGGPFLLGELCLSAIVLLFLPGRLFDGKRVKRDKPVRPVLPDGLKGRLDRTAAAFRDLYDSLGRGSVPNTDENPAVVFDRAAEKTCRGCALCDLCWKREYTATFNALNDATPFLLERGKALPKDFPPYFAQRCIHMPEFITAINGELTAFLLRRRYRTQLAEARKDVRGQYAQLSDLLSATAASLPAEPAFAENQSPYRIGAALRPKKGESVCGDTVSSFETETGQLCLLLADGMGSGEDARRESALLSRLMKQFLQAGIDTESALKTINSALHLRCTENGGFSTLDLFTMDLKRGNAVLYKYGAAPSYVKRGGKVRRITGAALPVGLRTAPSGPDVTRFPTEPGSFIVLVSDGVADVLHDEWLLDLLAGWDGTDPQILAGLILQEAGKRTGFTDDCGVQILYLLPGRDKQPQAV